MKISKIARRVMSMHCFMLLTEIGDQVSLRGYSKALRHSYAEVMILHISLYYCLETFACSDFNM